MIDWTHQVANLKKERQANEFACELLMPESLIDKYMEENEVDDFSDLDKMAKALMI
jgi:Zn-dependent peptidase ImmA (M78 family)